MNIAALTSEISSLINTYTLVGEAADKLAGTPVALHLEEEYARLVAATQALQARRDSMRRARRINLRQRLRR